IGWCPHRRVFAPIRRLASRCTVSCPTASSSTMRSVAPREDGSRRASWLERTTPARPLALFRMTFALLWLFYDVLDVALRGTANQISWLRALDGRLPPGLPILQAGLIGCELLLLIGIRPRAAALSAAAFRAAEAWIIPLNDFLYYIVTILVLAWVDPEVRPLSFPRKDDMTRAWPKDLLVWQAAWIYFATAFLKLNPQWLSGGHLFVRHHYLASTHGWPYPF